MKIAICDDDRMDLHYIRTLILEYDSTLDTTLFHTAKDLLAAFQTAFFDIVFMDIEMEHPNGYEAAEILMQQEDKPLIIGIVDNAAHNCLRSRAAGPRIWINAGVPVFGLVLGAEDHRTLASCFDNFQQIVGFLRSKQSAAWRCPQLYKQ